MPSGMGYDLCINVCDQVGHAEIVALALAGIDAAGCTAYIEGRDYICTNCQAALFKAGVKSWVLGPPPAFMPRTMWQRFLAWLFKHTDNETERNWEDRQW